MKRQIILEAWNVFSTKILPPGCSEIQKIETRRAFFAGASAMFAVICHGEEIMGGTDEEGAAVLDDINSEIEFYVQRLKSGAM